jgi:hypothetical protein
VGLPAELLFPPGDPLQFIGNNTVYSRINLISFL